MHEYLESAACVLIRLYGANNLVYCGRTHIHIVYATVYAAEDPSRGSLGSVAGVHLSRETSFLKCQAAAQLNCGRLVEEG
jgi:hypothetical protein